MVIASSLKAFRPLRASPPLLLLTKRLRGSALAASGNRNQRLSAQRVGKQLRRPKSQACKAHRPRDVSSLERFAFPTIHIWSPRGSFWGPSP